MKLADVTKIKGASIRLITEEAEYRYRYEEVPAKREEYRLLKEAGYGLQAYLATGRAWGQAAAYVDSLRGREAFKLIQEIAEELRKEWHLYDAARKVLEKRCA